MTNEEKQELARKVWIASSILVIAIITGLFPGYWFFVLCFIGVAWPVEKKIAEVFSKQIKNAKDKLFGFFDAVYRRIEPTWLGRFLDNTFPPPVANDLEAAESQQSRYDSDSGSYSKSVSSIVLSVESDDEENLSAPSTDIDDEENTEVKSIASTVVSTESELSRHDSDSGSYNESTSRIASGLGQSIISSQFSNCTTESKHSGYDSDIESDEEEMDFVELTENADQLTSSLHESNESDPLRRSLTLR